MGEALGMSVPPWPRAKDRTDLATRSRPVARLNLRRRGCSCRRPVKEFDGRAKRQRHVSDRKASPTAIEFAAHVGVDQLVEMHALEPGFVAPVCVTVCLGAFGVGAAPAFAQNPPGNNGTIKIDDVAFDDHPNELLPEDTVFIGEDDASGGGSEAELDGSETYTLDFTGD
jgi:hypothetical protein